MDNNKESFINRISYREELNKKQRTDNLANKLLIGEIGPTDLNDNEVDEMIEYFTQDIKEKNKRIEDLKKQIQEKRKELANG